MGNIKNRTFALGIRNKKRGQIVSPHFLNLMDKNKERINKVGELAEKALHALPGYFLVNVKIHQGNEVKVYIDADNGASIDQLAAINRSLHKWINEENLFTDGNFGLEVSSPGLSEPLKLIRQYHKNKNRRVEVLLNNGIKKTGILTEVTDSGITLDKEEVPFDQIKYTKVCIGF